MGEDRREPSVRYLPEDSSVKLLECFSGQSTSSEPRKPPKTHSGRETALRIIKIALPVCLIIAGPTLTFFWLRHVEQGSSPGEHSSYSILGDVTNLTLESREGSSFTVTWEPPESPIGYYLVEVTEDSDGVSGNTQKHLTSSCAGGTIVNPDQTGITWSYQKACARASFTVHACRKGPPEVISRGSTIKGIVIPGRAPDPPLNITILGKSPSLTRLQWEPPEKISGTIIEYRVKVCGNSTSCDAEERLSSCIERETPATWLEFESRPSTTYCALVTVSAVCGTDVLRSPPATLEFRTPLFDLPDVAHLRLVSTTENSFTATWERPETAFDYYRIEVITDIRNRSTQAQPHRVGSCTSGTIIHPDQTRVTCSLLHACTDANFIVRTCRRGPPELTSLGVALHDIFIPGQGPDPPKSVSISGISSYLTRLQWAPPAVVPGNNGSYIVKVCKTFNTCSGAEYMAGCTERKTSHTWLEFQSNPDTSYCASVTAVAHCKGDVLTSRPVTQIIRTPVLELPDVSNLTLVSAEENSFTVAWERPAVRFDYYTVMAKGHNIDRNRGNGATNAGSCARGTILHPDQTQLTCRCLDPCSAVSITVHTYIKGPPEVTSAGVTLSDIHITEPLDVVDLKLAAVDSNSFTVDWKRPRGCFDSYFVDFVDENRNSGGPVKQRFGTCRNTTIGPEQTTITCQQLEACTNVSVKVRTQRGASPKQTSPGVVQKGIFIAGGAPERFRISATRELPNEAHVDIFAANIASCMLGSCSVLLKGYRHMTPFDCLPYIRRPRPFHILLPRGPPSRRYVIMIRLTNRHNGLSATKTADVGPFLD